MNGNAVRINISLPAQLAKDLRKRTGKREFSKFLAEAAQEKLSKERKERAIREILEAPAAFPEIKDSVKWVRKLRLENENRFKRVWRDK